MEILSIENRGVMEAQLKELGFMNYSELINGLIESPDFSTVSERIANMGDLKSDPNGIGYIFFAIKREPDPQWFIERIEAYVSLLTVRDVEAGEIHVGKVYKLEDGPLPPEKEIREEVLKVVEAEKEVEKVIKLFYNDHKLKEELIRLGFDDFHQMVTYATYKNGLIAMRSRQSIKPGHYEDAEIFAFQLVLSYDKNIDQIKLISIKAALEAPVETDIYKKRLEYTSKIYGGENDAFSSKEQMINDLLKRPDLMVMQLDKAKQMVQSIKDNRASKINNPVYRKTHPQRL